MIFGKKHRLINILLIIQIKSHTLCTQPEKLNNANSDTECLQTSKVVNG